MHAISSYRGNRPTNTQTHTQTQSQTHIQDRLQYTAPLSLARSVITGAGDHASAITFLSYYTCVQAETVQHHLFLLLICGAVGRNAQQRGIIKCNVIVYALSLIH